MTTFFMQTIVPVGYFQGLFGALIHFIHFISGAGNNTTGSTKQWKNVFVSLQSLERTYKYASIYYIEDLTHSSN